MMPALLSNLMFGCASADKTVTEAASTELHNKTAVMILL